MNIKAMKWWISSIVRDMKGEFLNNWKFPLKIFFSCRLFALQYCAMPQHESLTGIHVFPSSRTSPPTSHPILVHTSRLSQNPVSHSRFLLALLRVVKSTSPCYCQCIRPLPPTLCPQAWFLCLCLHGCPANRFISTSFLIWWKWPTHYKRNHCKIFIF